MSNLRQGLVAIGGIIIGVLGAHSVRQVLTARFEECMDNKLAAKQKAGTLTLPEILVAR